MSLSAITVWTVGHGNRALDELIALLQEAEITRLVDVRAQPRSARHPQFNDDALRAACEQAGLVYHMAGRQLGGLRVPRAGSPHVALGEGRRGFADHMQTDGFKKGIAQLVHLAAQAHTAMLCAERDPERCHRALISDYLLLQGVRVVHLLAPGEAREHILSPEARRESAELVYDRHASGELDFG